MRAKVSKSERYLLGLTVVFLCVLAALFYRDSQIGQSGTYTVATERTAQEQVAPEPLLIDINTAGPAAGDRSGHCPAHRGLSPGKRPLCLH